MDEQIKNLQNQIDELKSSQLAVIMTQNADANLYRSLQRTIQNPSINFGVGTSNPDINCIADFVSVNMAFRLPCMTSTQRDAIITPREGMLIYNLTTHALNDYDGSVWGAV